MTCQTLLHVNYRVYAGVADKENTVGDLCYSCSMMLTRQHNIPAAYKSLHDNVYALSLGVTFDSL